MTRRSVVICTVAQIGEPIRVMFAKTHKKEKTRMKDAKMRHTESVAAMSDRLRDGGCDARIAS